MEIVHSFKANNKKLNNYILNNSNKYHFTSSKDSLIRIRDFRKLPVEKETKGEIKYNNKFINEYININAKNIISIAVFNYIKQIPNTLIRDDSDG